MQHVPFYDFKTLQSQRPIDSIIQKVSQLIKDYSLIEGPYNQKFEAEFAKYLEAKHCLLVANGTDALEIALQVNGIGPQDLVGVPAVTYHATAEAVVNIGAKVVLIDIIPQTGLMDPESLRRVLKTKKLKAIMPVHLYGMPVEMEEIEQIALEFGIKIVEDAAQAHGALVGNKKVGNSNNIVTFSFYPTKNLGAFGDAGAMIFPNNSNGLEMYEQAKMIRNHGRVGTKIIGFGRNSRCDHIQACILDALLPEVDVQKKLRSEIAIQYYKLLQNNPHLNLMPARAIEESSWHLFPILFKTPGIKKYMMEQLHHFGVEVANHYDQCLADLPALSNKLSSSDEFKAARVFCDQVICLPNFPTMTKSQVEYVCQTLEKVLEKNNSIPKRVYEQNL